MRLSGALLLATACAGPQASPAAPAPAATDTSSALAPETLPVEAAAEPPDAAPDDADADAGSDGSSSDAASASARKVTCQDAATWLNYQVDLGPNENSARMGKGPSDTSDEDRRSPIRATLTALSMPADVDAFNFATYLPYYVALAYQDAIEAGHPGLRGDVRIVIALGSSGAATQVKITAPGFPKSFVDEVRERASTSYVSCAPLAAAAEIKATMRLAPRKPKLPGRR